MAEQDDLLASIATTTADYREGDLAAPTPAHVDRWVKQFDTVVQVPILREMDHVLKQTYISRATIKEFLSSRISDQELTGGNPAAFWSKAHILDIQQRGQSRKHIRELFGEAVREQLNLDIDVCGAPGGPFIYLDDVIFSGGRTTNDIREWLQKFAPKTSAIYVIVLVRHRGSYQIESNLKQFAENSGKNVTIRILEYFSFENRVTYRNSSDVLWPASIPNDPQVTVYMANQGRFPLQPRVAGAGKSEVEFTSEPGRQVLETEFLRAGVKIRGFCQNPNAIMLPLGFSNFGVGFGSTIVTYRNCPNNAPLALWWGDPNASPNHPFSKWYPLFPRRTYDQGVDFDDFDF